MNRGFFKIITLKEKDVGQIKYETKEVIRAIGESGLSEEKVTIDKAYKKITGVRAYTLTDGGLPYHEIGLKDRETTFHNLTPDEDWAPTVDYFYKPLNIVNRGQDFFISTKLPTAAAGTDLKIQLVFRLEN